jgi:hypothetical protein
MIVTVLVIWGWVSLSNKMTPLKHAGIVPLDGITKVLEKFHTGAVHCW